MSRLSTIGIYFCLFQLLWPLQMTGQSAQPPLTLWNAWRLAREHYPSTRQQGLIEKTREYSVENASRGYWPQLSLAGQATLQSDVTSLPIKVPIAGFTLPSYSKDQYKIYGEVDQVLYDGGLIRSQKEAATTAGLIAEKSLDVELRNLYDRVNQLYFGILLLDGQLVQNDLLQQDIRNGIDKMKALVDNGVAYQSNLDELQAQWLQAGQARTENRVLRKAYLDMLGLLTGTVLEAERPLMEPPELSLLQPLSRPELELYEFQKKNYDLQDQLVAAQLRPRIGLFFQGGYARPGLNLLSNSFAFYYVGGLRLNWNLGGLYTVKRQRELSDLGRHSLDLQKETFLLNLQLQQQQFNSEILKYAALIKSDDPIILLRTSVKMTALAQLTNGALSAHDYLTQVIAEDQARQNRILHLVQWLQSEYNYQALVGH